MAAAPRLEPELGPELLLVVGTGGGAVANMAAAPRLEPELGPELLLVVGAGTFGPTVDDAGFGA